jgi:hypothetical protein
MQICPHLSHRGYTAISLKTRSARSECAVTFFFPARLPFDAPRDSKPQLPGSACYNAERERKSKQICRAGMKREDWIERRYIHEGTRLEPAKAALCGYEFG